MFNQDSNTAVDNSTLTNHDQQIQVPTTIHYDGIDYSLDAGVFESSDPTTATVTPAGLVQRVPDTLGTVVTIKYLASIHVPNYGAVPVCLTITYTVQSAPTIVGVLTSTEVSN